MLLLRRGVRAAAWAVLLVDLFVLVVWAASGGGPFWPVWVWLGTGLLGGGAAIAVSVRSSAKLEVM